MYANRVRFVRGAMPRSPRRHRHSRYRLHQVGRQTDGSVAYAVYGAPDITDEEVARVAEERAYARRFEAEPQLFEH